MHGDVRTKITVTDGGDVMVGGVWEQWMVKLRVQLWNLPKKIS